ncbi:MAG: hypothetical protein NTV86_13140 [Planctomycetota bacterium]|nr:hypothetical protein [Planctomycetota bacterium]
MRKFVPALAVLLTAALAAAVAPVTTVHDTEAEFAAGELSSVAVSNMGELRLAGAVEILVPSAQAPTVVSAVAAAGDELYAGDGLSARVFRRAGGKTEVFAKLPGAIVTALRAQGEKLLAGTGGAGAGVFSIDRKTGQVETIWADASVKYVWALLPAPGGALYAATGPQARCFLIAPGGKADVIYQAGKDLADNLRCLALHEGKLYAGTDKNGLILQIDPAAKTGRVLFDATEPEITSLQIGPKGEIYAATAGAIGEPPVTAPKAASSPVALTAPAPASKPAEAPEPSPAPPSGDSASATRPTPSEEAAATGGASGSEAAADSTTQDPSLAKDAASASAGPVVPPAGQGNAVYCIDPDGLVRTVIRRGVNFLCMALVDDQLILGAGNEGRILSVSTAGDRCVQLASVEAKRITALLPRPDGGVVFATANPGSLAVLARKVAPTGTFTCKAVDAGQVARWGSIQLEAALPGGARLTVATRSGNIQTPDEKAWSPWTAPAALDGRFHKVTSPAGRFLQYRLTLSPSPQGASPIVRSVSLVSQVGNLPPVISSATVTPAAAADESDREGIKAAGRKVFRVIHVQAVDPNGDTLLYRFEYRPADSAKWIELAKDVAAPMYAWNTLTVADGSYELRVTASDKASNTPEQAIQSMCAPLATTVDHTPPVVSRLVARIEGTTVTVSGSARDALSRITSIYRNLDSQESWVAVLPADGLCDDQAEEFAFMLKDLPAGAHQVTVRVRDAYGNVAYQSIPVIVQK